MGSHAYCNVIFGVPVGSYILRNATEEDDEFLIEDLLAESDKTGKVILSTSDIEISMQISLRN